MPPLEQRENVILEPPLSPLPQLLTSKPPIQISREKSKCSVRFQLTASVKTIPHYSEMELDELTKIWFTGQELSRTLKEATQTVAAMNEGIPLSDNDTEFTTRGLEYMTPKGFDITNASLGAVKLVLEEQEQQRQNENYSGQLDSELIAATIGGISRHRSRIAHLAAMKDARSVYGDGNFKTTADLSCPRRTRSFDRKKEPRRTQPRRTGSMGAVQDRTRRRRGLRGAQPEAES